MYALLLIGCSSSCPETPLLLADAGHEQHLEYVAASVTWLDWWTEGLCIDRVQVSPNAPLGGDAWNTDDGWSVTVLPDELPIGSLENQLCRAYAYEAHPLVLAPDDLFPAEPGHTRVDAFAAACAVGPTFRTYIEHEVSACRAEPLTLEQDFLAREVFTGEPLTTADDWELEETETLELQDYSQRVHTQVALDALPVDGLLTLQQWGYASEDTTYAVLHDDLRDTYRRASLSLGGVEAFVATADDTNIYVHGAPAGQAFSGRSQWVVDRQTGAVTERALGFTFNSLHSWFDSALVRGAGWTAVTSTAGEWGGRVGVVFDDGTESLLYLVPRAPAGTVAPQRIWVDPTSDHHLLATLSHQDYVISRSNPIYITGHYDDTVRIDVRTGEVEVVWTTADPPARPTRRRLQGVLSDGSLVYAVASSTDEWLIGRAEADGTLSLSPTLCTDWSGVWVEDDAVVTHSYRGRLATRRWLRTR